MGNWKHGHCKNNIITPTYTIWASMHARCNNSKNKAYKWYGGRGIVVCDRWKDFRHFLSDMGERPKGLTIERKDNDGNYKPNNCKWATQQEQQQNKRGVKLTPNEVRIIRYLAEDTQFLQEDLAYAFRVNVNHIWKIIHRRTWANI